MSTPSTEKSPECLGDLSHIPNHKIEKCRLCGSDNLQHLFSLGDHYVNDFVPLEKVKTGPRCPITLLLCKDCSLVQQQYSAPQELLYTRHYWYYSGVTQTMKDALRDVVKAGLETVEVGADDVWLDIGANDGTLLSYVPDHVFCAAVEPAENMFSKYMEHADYGVPHFWDADRYIYGWPPEEPLKHPKVITAIGMFYDLEDPNKFIGDVARVLHKDGIFVAQLMCLKNMLNLRDVGNLAHEHLEFYSLQSLHHLFSAHGLELFDIEKNSVNGESYRLYVRHKGSHHINRPGSSWRLAEAHLLENGLDEPETYARFYRQLEKNKDECRRFIHAAVVSGKKVALMGASTKGNTILQYYGLDNSLIHHASERSKEKVGKYTVGTGIPIYSETQSRYFDPDYYLILPYAFADEIMRRESNWRQECDGRRFLIPLPEFRVV